MSYTAYRNEDGELFTEDQVEDMFDDMLNDCYPTVDIAGYEYSPATALERVDPIAYRSEFLNYVDAYYAEESFESFDEMWSELN